MSIIICPGIHEPSLTHSFLSGFLGQVADRSTLPNSVDILTFPTQGCLAVSPFHILQFLHNHLSHKLRSPVVFISFSAGVVGAIIAAHQWQLLGGCIKAFIAIDGWGVPLWGNFPIHRLSHDYFTHWSSSLLGSGHNNFYADPSVDHLEMWHSPEIVQGYWVEASGDETPTKEYLTVAEFLHCLLKRYEEN